MSTPRRRYNRVVYTIGVLLFASLLGYAAFSKNDGERQLYRSFRSTGQSSRLLREPPVLEGFMQEHRPIPTDYQEFNDIALRKLHVCLATETCTENQGKVVIFNSQWFREGIAEGWKGGEGVWAKSMYRSLTNLGYTLVMTQTNDELLRVYRQMPDRVKVVVTKDLETLDHNEKYVQSEAMPDGIPIWKMFHMTFFPSTGKGLLGHTWAINAVPHPVYTNDFHYLGYSIEDECMAVPEIPFDSRPKRAWLFAKQLTYAYHPEFAWNRTWFERLLRDVPGLEIKGAFAIDEKFQWNVAKSGHFDDVPGGLAGVDNIGPIGGDRFNEELRHSRVLLGIGNPWYSPSPHLSLCLGVPFINVIRNWKEDEPENKKHWKLQQPELLYWDPPFVYNVKKGDYDGLRDAVAQALTMPIPRTVIPAMKQAAHEARMRDFVEEDWRALATEELRRRQDAGEVSFYM